MKKFLSIILIVSLVLAIGVTACGAGSPTVTEDKIPVMMGLITLHDENSTYDKNFIEAFKNVCEARNVHYLIKTGVGENSEAYEAAADLADAGCSIVFADSFGHEDYLMQAAREFPEVQFCHATGTKAHTAGIPNYHNAFAAIYEGRFLNGVALGMKLNEIVAATGAEPKVGYVGAYSYAEVISGYNSFFLGVRSVCPEATMLVTFTGSWYDETAEKEAAYTLIDQGCVVISAHADSMGMPTACEQLGIPFVGYNGSFKESCPTTYVASTRINWEPYFNYLVTAYRSNEVIDTDWTGTIETGSVEMCELNTDVAVSGTDKALENLKNEFVNGRLKVYDTSTFTVNGEVLTSYLADVDTDAAYTPDTEVVKDGYFHESEYRSAPYFDLNVDGISLLNTAF